VVSIQIQMEIYKAWLTYCPGALTKSLSFAIGEILEVFESTGISSELNAGR